MSQLEVSNCLSTNKFYVKRRLLKEDEPIPNKSMFGGAKRKPFDDLTLVEDLKKFQTLPTAIDNTITLHSNNEETFSTMEKSHREEKSQFLPKLNIALQAKLARSKNQIRSQDIKTKQKAYSHHDSDPLYIKLQKTVSKRVSNKFSQYKKSWIDCCQRRKQKSVIERSFDKAATSIEHINLDAGNRKNTTQLSEMLRNNIAEKTFVFPGKLKPEIPGLKGKGGKVIPIFSEVFMVEEVYKYNKKKGALE